MDRTLSLLIAALALPSTAPAQRACVWNPAQDIPVSRFEGPAIPIDGKMIVFGGFNAPFPGVTTRIDSYDPVADSWTQIGDMPTLLTHAPPALDGRTVWFVGGFVGHHPGAATTVSWMYDVDTQVWSNGPNLPVPTAGGGLVRLDRELHYVGGVLADRDTTTTDHWVLDLDNTAAGWTSEPPLPTGRCHPSAVGHGGLLYVFGGQDRHDTNPVDRFEVEVYDPATNTWSTRAPLPFSRSHCEPGTYIGSDGRIVLTGGKSSSLGLPMIPDANAYDTLSDSWSVLPSLPRPLLAPCAVPLGGEIITCAGATTNFEATTPTQRRPESETIPSEYRVNVGGAHWTSPNTGDDWCNDHGVDGSLFHNPGITDITGTDDDEIYLYERYSNGAQADTLVVRYPLNPGFYRVRLHFAELYWGAPGGPNGGPGKRVFDVFLEDELVLDDYDTWVEVGSMAADVKSFDVLVEDLSLDLRLVASENRAKLNAIEILALPGSPFETYCQSTANSTGSPARMGFHGTVSLAEANLELRAGPVPDQFGLFFYGPNAVELPFGNGFRCVGGSLARLPLHLVSGGTLVHLVDYDSPPGSANQITAGSTWYFQAWYRDPLAGGAAFDTSDGLKLEFTP